MDCRVLSPHNAHVKQWKIRVSDRVEDGGSTLVVYGRLTAGEGKKLSTPRSATFYMHHSLRKSSILGSGRVLYNCLNMCFLVFTLFPLWCLLPVRSLALKLTPRASSMCGFELLAPVSSGPPTAGPNTQLPDFPPSPLPPTSLTLLTLTVAEAELAFWGLHLPDAPSPVLDMIYPSLRIGRTSSLSCRRSLSYTPFSSGSLTAFFQPR